MTIHFLFLPAIVQFLNQLMKVHGLKWNVLALFVHLCYAKLEKSLKVRLLQHAQAIRSEETPEARVTQRESMSAQFRGEETKFNIKAISLGLVISFRNKPVFSQNCVQMGIFICA